MKELKIEEIFNLWEKERNPIGIYIHSPYCKTLCSYCVYRGCLNQSSFNEYYQKFLLEEYDKFEPIISKKEVNHIYFGGGTPNINGSLNHLIPILEKLQNVECKEKVIELHTGWEITEDQIDLLKKYNFNTIILCVQTFNEDILNKVGRYHSFKNDLDKVIGWCQDRRIHVGLDLMCFPEYDINILRDDLNTINSFKNFPEEITIGLEYQQRSEKTIKEYSTIIFNFLKHSLKYPEDYVAKEVIPLMKGARLFSRNGKTLFDRKKFFTFLSAMDDFNLSPTIGIGSYNNIDKWTYSACGKYVYHTEFTENDKEPKYYLDSALSYWDKIRNVINWAESIIGERAPLGLNVSFSNYPESVSETVSNESYRNNWNAVPIQFNINYGNIFDCSKEINALNESMREKGIYEIELNQNPQ